MGRRALHRLRTLLGVAAKPLVFLQSKVVQPNRDKLPLAAKRDSAPLWPELDLGEDEVRGAYMATVMPALAHTRKWQTVKHNTLGPKI